MLCAKSILALFGGWEEEEGNDANKEALSIFLMPVEHYETNCPG
jgi:hypothetical protein